MAPQSIVKEPSDRWLVLVLLILLKACCIGQMAVMAILTEPIKTHYGLSDSGVVFLISVLYAVFAVGSSIPLGIVTDLGNRRVLIAICAGLFSVAFAVPLVTDNYTLLLISRAATGVGHSSFAAIVISLLSDKFGPASRPVAMTLLSLSGSLGAWICISGGGYLVGVGGWPMAMGVIGLVSLAITVVTCLFVREPVRGSLDRETIHTVSPSVSFLETLRFCWTQKSVYHSIAGGIVVNFFAFGLAWWSPAFLNRNFGTSPAEAGAMLGPIHGVLGIVAVLLSSAILVRLSYRDPQASSVFLAVTAALCTIPGVAMVFSHTAAAAILCMWLFIPIVYIYYGPCYAAVVNGVPPHMRGQASAILYAGSNLASMTLAALIVGALSDLIASQVADPAMSLRYALFPISLTGMWAALHFWSAARHQKADMARLVALEDPEREGAPSDPEPQPV